MKILVKSYFPLNYLYKKGKINFLQLVYFQHMEKNRLELLSLVLYIDKQTVLSAYMHDFQYVKNKNTLTLQKFFSE